MSIPVVCSCGKSMRAPAEWAGRDAKCPGCGQPVHIPGPGSAAATAPVKTSNPPVTPCPECGKPLLVPPGMAGKLVACPACGGHVKLPGKPAGVTAAAPRVKVPTVTVPASRPKSKSQLQPKPAKVATFEMDDPDDDFDQDDDDFQESRRGKKRKSGKKMKAGSGNLLLVCLLGGGGALLAVGLIVAIVFLVGRGGASTPVLAMVPADVDAFGMVRMSTLIRTPSGQKLRKMIADMKKGNANEIDKYQDVVAFSRPGQKGPLIVSWCLVPVSVADSEKNLIDTHTKGELGGKVFFAAKNPSESGILVHGPNTLIEGAESDIVDYLKQPPAPAGPMASVLRAAGSDGSMIFIGFQGSALRRGAGPMNPMAIGEAIPDFETGRFTMNDGTHMVGNLALDFSDAAKAGMAKDNLDKMLDAARLMVPMQMKMMPGPMGGLVEKTLAKAKPGLSGATVNVPIEIDMSMGDLVEKVQPMLAGLAMMGGGMGPGFGPGPGIGPGPGPGPGIPQPKTPGKKKRS